MLIWMREKKRVLVKFIAWPLIFVFIALYGSSKVQNQHEQNRMTALTVNGTRVPISEYQAVSDEVNKYLSDLPITPEKSRSQLALEEVIQRELARQLARDLNLRTDDAQVLQEIRRQFTGGKGGQINDRQMAYFLQQSGFASLDAFKEYIRSQMDIRLAMNYVSGTAVPSEDEIQRALKRQRENRTIEAVLFNAEDYLDKVEAATEEVKAYFKQHAERYRYPKRMKIDYIEGTPENFVGQATPERENLLRWFNSSKEQFLVPVEREVATITFPSRDFRNRVTFTEEDLINFYEAEKTTYMEPAKYRARFISVPVEIPDASIEAAIAKDPESFRSTKDSVAARHILLRTNPDTTEGQRQEILNKIGAIRSRIHSEEDFAREAKENSDDTTNRYQGGDLGFFQRGAMVAEFDTAAFTVSEATVSAPVMTSYGYHLIWVYAKRPAGELLSVREARLNPKTQSIDQAPVKDAARKKLQDIKLALAGKSLGAASSVTDLPILESDWFSRGEIPHPDAARDRYPFYQAADKLAPGGMSDVVEGFYRFYLIELIEKKEPRQKPFEEARADVEKGYRGRKAADFARTQAQEAAEKIRAGSLEFSQVSKVYGLPHGVTFTHLRKPEANQQQLPINRTVDREILARAFTVTTGKVEGPFDVLQGSMQGPTLLTLVHEEPEHLPEISEAENEAADAYRHVLAKENAQKAVWNVWISLDKFKGNLKKAAGAGGMEVKTSDFFQSGMPVPGFPPNSIVNYAAASLRVVGATTSVLEDPPSSTQNPQPLRAYYLLQAATIEETRLPRFEEVSAEVRKDLKLERVAPMVKADAEKTAAEVAGLLKQATTPFSASRSIDLGSFVKQRNLKLAGPIQVKLDSKVPNLPGENSGAAVALTAYQLPLGGVSHVVPIFDLVREGEGLAERNLGLCILQVIDIKAPRGSASSRGEAFRALSSSLQGAVQGDWSHRGRIQAQVHTNEEMIPKEAVEQLARESGKSLAK
jgi:parvulin-like peptidyl-prolyl isomerase